VEERDLPAIASLHRRAFGPAGGVADERLEDRLSGLFFEHPWPDERLPSLLYEEPDGEVIGCLGVMARPMVLDGRPLLAAVSHNFMVAPDRRPSLVALELLRAFFAGPQELSIAEGNDASRRLWSTMGGTTALAYSFRWIRPLRPASLALWRLEGRGLPGPLATLLRPLGAGVDLAAARALPGGRPRVRPEAALAAEPLDGATLVDCVDRFARRRSLRPSWDESSIERVLDLVVRCSDQGPLRRVLLRRRGQVAGWYLYFPERPGLATVLQVAASAEAAVDVLDHLFADAWERGARALCGQVDPALLPALAERMCILHRGAADRWLLVHGSSERALRALHLGDAFFTHLEGEWWL
jgi:hypothetical protein